MHKINHANIKDWAKNYDGPLFDGILCDPPYELNFMGKSWDSSGIAFDSEMWADIYKLLKPGAHLLAFSGSRTYHRMAVAIEDAGFEIRDTIIWCYGSGFPKALDISKAIDKMQGNERDKVRHKARPETSGTMSGSSDTRPWIEKSREKGYHEVAGDVPISEQAKLYQGYKTSLKPAHEPCVLARKPLDGTVANNVLKHGTGGLNIDGTRVGADQSYTNSKGNSNTMDSSKDIFVVPNKLVRAEPNNLGRFPANLIHDGSDEVEAVFPQTGKSTPRTATKGGTGGVGVSTSFQRGSETGGFSDSGSASRFFYTAKLTQEELCESSNYLTQSAHSTPSTQNVTTVKSKVGNSTSSLEESCTKQSCATNVTASEKLQGASHFYCAKASKSERNAGLEGFEEKETRRYGDFQGTPEHAPKLDVRNTNHHPTVKPLSLTKYLATLIKPPTGGRLLVPFSGSGSEMIGALQAGWEYVEGVELTEEYIPIAEARIKYWQNIPQTSSKPKVSAKNAEPVQHQAESLTLF